MSGGRPRPADAELVDDRSGIAYQEYRCVYGEDVAAALRFLFNAMAPKDEAGLVLQSIPKMLYLDNGPIAKSGVFRRVMAHLGVEEPEPAAGRRASRPRSTASIGAACTAAAQGAADSRATGTPSSTALTVPRSCVSGGGLRALVKDIKATIDALS